MDNEGIPYYFDTIDRNATIIKPKKPFQEWLKSIYEDGRQPFKKGRIMYTSSVKWKVLSILENG